MQRRGALSIIGRSHDVLLVPGLGATVVNGDCFAGVWVILRRLGMVAPERGRRARLTATLVAGPADARRGLLVRRGRH
jgi:hypothetical protein